MEKKVNSNIDSSLKKSYLLRVIFQIQNCCRRKINHITVNTEDRHDINGAQ